MELCSKLCIASKSSTSASSAVPARTSMLRSIVTRNWGFSARAAKQHRSQNDNRAAKLALILTWSRLARGVTR